MNPTDRPVVEPDVPLGQIISARGHWGQLYQYAAVLMGIKPALDDWIPVHRVSAFLATCRYLGLLVETDMVFRDLAEDAMISGAGRLCTTRAEGMIWDPSAVYPPGSQLHLFVGREPSAVKEAWRRGWYPIVINGQVVDKPLPDVAAFGRSLGYPACCIEAFSKHNDWRRSNSYEAASARTKLNASSLTNPFGRHTPWSYIFHLPCSFDCSITEEYSKALRESLRREQPGYAKQIESFNKLTFFVTNENRAYALQGKMRNPNHACYQSSFFLGGLRAEDVYGPLLAKGNELSIRDNLVLVLRNGELQGIIETRSDCSGPEAPLLIQFE
jgi:hypothetical protein